MGTIAAYLVCEGLPNREIAAVVGTTEQVIKNCLTVVYYEFSVDSRMELLRYMIAHPQIYAALKDAYEKRVPRRPRSI
jgi:DNA-binding NarL/FixJ family response regulator